MGINQHGIKIYSDYAHHPTEVQTTYQALCDNFPNHQIYIIYQAHQVGRIFNLRDEMVQVCAGIDELVLYHIYTAREDVSSLIAQQDRDIFVDVKNADDLASLLA